MEDRRPTLASAPGSLLVPPVRSTGRPLEPATRQQLEERLGHDFGSVRVHDGSEAAAAAASIGAQAFTRGEDIVLGRGQRASASLLAHELTHVVQQRRTTRLEPRVSQPGEASEHLASAGRTDPLASVPAIQRQPAPGAGPDLLPRSSQWAKRSLGRLTIDGFPLGKATLTPDQKDQIRFHASVLKGLLDAEPDSRASVTGHGDSVGPEERNLAIGTDRAEAVAAELAAAGIPRELIDTDSAGEFSPAVPSKAAEARNRRAVIGFSPALRMTGLAGRLKPPTFDVGPKSPTDPVGGATVKDPDWWGTGTRRGRGIGPGTGIWTGTGTGTGTGPGPGAQPEEPHSFDWKRSEEMMRRAREIEKRLPKDRSPLERLGDAAVEVLDPLIKKLPIPDDWKQKARDGIRSGIESGTEKGCEAAIDASGLKGEAAEGAKEVCKGLVKSKPSGSGSSQ